MIASTRAQFLAVCLGLMLLPVFTAKVSAQTNYYSTNGTEYAVVGAMPGDQVFPDIAISTTGGFLVWQDNVTDGDYAGVSARRLDSTLSGALSPFRVNATGAGSQENARVALLRNGGAVFVWQGGKPSYQHIFARFLTPTNTFLTTTDLQVNTFGNNFQINPAVTVLNNSNVVVVWGSFNQADANSMQDVYGQILSPTGQKIGGEFRVNQATAFNQRTPSVAALPGGGFIVTWISEQERDLAPVYTTNSSTPATSAAGTAVPSVDVYSRTYSSSGTPAGGETLVNTSIDPCATPSVAVASDGSYIITWAAHDSITLNNGFDIFGRTFDNTGAATAAVFRINSFLYGDQYTPRVSALGLDYLVTWTSLAQDGSFEGVYEQFVHKDGSMTGNEFRVNTTTISRQMHPVVAADGANQFLVVWTGFTGVVNKFDLFAQRYLNVNASLQPMSAPYVWAPFVLSSNVYQPRLVVTWAPLLGISVSNYEVFVDGAVLPNPTVTVTSNMWTMTAAYGLTTNSTHLFQVDYVTMDGRRPSALSPATSGTTWSGRSWGGIPYEWMTEYFTSHTNIWWSPSAPVSAGGPTLYTVFLSGGDPFDSSTWLQQQLVKTGQGLFLTWNTQPGAIYQVQSTANFTTWSNVGSPRFAAGTTDSIYVGGSPVGYYRVLLMR
ncbi:MAG: hypothetical protein JF609_10035 [Verrucomicrobia bacterium]|nr:hypothetical protein [Verrucomicrobiota bacterium]